MDHEVVLELTLLAVINDVDSGIDLLIPHLAEVLHSGPPLLGVFADEVVVRDVPTLRLEGILRGGIRRFAAGDFARRVAAPLVAGVDELDMLGTFGDVGVVDDQETRFPGRLFNGWRAPC